MPRSGNRRETVAVGGFGDPEIASGDVMFIAEVSSARP
jgi:hypothetical protein